MGGPTSALPMLLFFFFFSSSHVAACMSCSSWGSKQARSSTLSATQESARGERNETHRRKLTIQEKEKEDNRFR
ncbi:hypothetical protein V8C44DRAFT_319289 [Trichoderma aethiopicum]